MNIIGPPTQILFSRVHSHCRHEMGKLGANDPSQNCKQSLTMGILQTFQIPGLADCETQKLVAKDPSKNCRPFNTGNSTDVSVARISI